MEAKTAALKEELTSSNRMGKETNNFHIVWGLLGETPTRAGDREEGGSGASFSVKRDHLLWVLKEPD